MHFRAEQAKKALRSAYKPLVKTLPVILGVVLLVSLINNAIPKDALAGLFAFSKAVNVIIGASLGSILGGNPITSYIIGGEFLDQGVQWAAVSGFLISWVTVGIIQLPAESMILSKKFAIIRNSLSFIFAIIAGVILSLVIA